MYEDASGTKLRQASKSAKICLHSEYISAVKKAKAAQNAPLTLLLFVKIETLVETINTSAGINELLLTCEERVAF